MSLLNSVDGVGSVDSWHRGCRGSSFGMGRVGRVGQENFGAVKKNDGGQNFVAGGTIDFTKFY